MKYPILKLLCLALLFGSCQKEKRPNVVLIFTDDQTYKAVGALGYNQVKTPNIDQLYSEGTSFTHAYNMGSWSGAVCTASRSMLISGMSVWNANKNRKKWHVKDSLSIANTWPKLMESAGYDTYMTGKWHVDVAADDIFQNTVHIRPGMPNDAVNHPQLMKEYKEGDAMYPAMMPVGYNRPLSATDTSWNPADKGRSGFWEGGKHWSEVLKDDALSFINKASKKDKPFFMYLAFNAPHDPRQSPQKYLDMYPVEDIELPKNFRTDYDFHEEIGLGYKLRDEALAPFPRTELAVKTHLREYYALITHLDEQIGGILSELKAKGLDENTYVFFTADHGLAIGSHGLMGKQNMYDHSMRVPLLVKGPSIPKGVSLDHDVFLQDIMPSALEVAGVQNSDFVEFKSLIPLATNISKSNGLDAVYGCYLGLQRMVRKDNFKLIAYPKAKKLRLFDLKNDPNELNDLAENPDYQTKVKELFAELEKLQGHYNDELDLAFMKP
ncbi:sulfatase-like hydrolase/transferase [uncultured Arcticibacterium sp.]|uniref:sulfatase-like hydrolase/transferase n=1 Tax=uncultured Arcticibacterium sp. TaxID=2173042 RepID=UPI0030F55E7B